MQKKIPPTFRKNHTQGLKYWQQRGIEDTFFQREAQTTFWSVLGGIAIGILVTQITPVLEKLRTVEWYQALYLVATLLIVVYSWVQTCWGSLVLRWQITVTGSLVGLFANIAIAYAAINIDNPQVWMGAIAVAMLFAFCMQLHFWISGAWDVFPEEKKTRYKSGLAAYALVVAAAAGFFLHMLFAPSQLLYIVYGCVAILVVIGLLIWQHIIMETEKREMKIS